MVTFLALVSGLAVAMYIRGFAEGYLETHHEQSSSTVSSRPTAPRVLISDDPGYVLDSLLMSHPDYWTRTELDSLSGHRFVLWHINDAEFGQMDKLLGGKARFGLAEVEDVIMPIISIPAATLLDTGISEAMLWRYLYHEGWHYRQYISGKCPAEILMPHEAAAEFAAVMQGDNLACWFESEVDAHSRDCAAEFGEEWDEIRALPICQTYHQFGQRGLRRHLAHHYLQQPIFAGRFAEFRDLAEK